MLLLLGVFTLDCARNSEALRWRWGTHPTMLHRLVDLPFAYFVDPRLRQVLLPTLLCACYREHVNFRILATRLAPEHLIVYLRREIEARDADGALGSLSASGGGGGGGGGGLGSAPSLAPAVLVDDPSELPIVSLEYGLHARLAPSRWAEAMRYLATRPESPLPVVEGVEPPQRRSE